MFNKLNTFLAQFSPQDIKLKYKSIKHVGINLLTATLKQLSQHQVKANSVTIMCLVWNVPGGGRIINSLGTELRLTEIKVFLW